LVQTREWLLNRIVESAVGLFNSIKPPKRKLPKSYNSETESAAHDLVVVGMRPDTVICYSDGSASPNPGPSGAGASIFIRGPDLVLDCGASLGRGSNNYAELYALGMIFSQLLDFPSSHSQIKSATIFSDSKLALAAVVSRKVPLTNGPITRALRKTYLAACGGLEISLHWIRGHVRIGGNERVDRISKSFASVAGNEGAHLFKDFSAQSSCTEWLPSFPLLGLPLSVFTSGLPQPKSCLREPSLVGTLRRSVRTGSRRNRAPVNGVLTDFDSSNCSFDSVSDCPGGGYVTGGNRRSLRASGVGFGSLDPHSQRGTMVSPNHRQWNRAPNSVTLSDLDSQSNCILDSMSDCPGGGYVTGGNRRSLRAPGVGFGSLDPHGQRETVVSPNHRQSPDDVFTAKLQGPVVPIVKTLNFRRSLRRRGSASVPVSGYNWGSRTPPVPGLTLDPSEDSDSDHLDHKHDD
jgi:ribonuclease HI